MVAVAKRFTVSTDGLFRVLVSGLEGEDGDQGEDGDGRRSDLLEATAADLGLGVRVSDAEARRVIEPLFGVAEEGRLAARDAEWTRPWRNRTVPKTRLAGTMDLDTVVIRFIYSYF